MNKEQLISEKDKLQKHLAWLGVRSTGSERIERKIEALDKLIIHYKNEEYEHTRRETS